jgi:hypothetical protein
LESRYGQHETFCCPATWGLPYTTEEGTGIPQPAFNILKKEGKMSQEELDDLTDQIVCSGYF